MAGVSLLHKSIKYTRNSLVGKPLNIISIETVNLINLHGRNSCT